MMSLVNQSNELQGLRAIFVAAGFDLWFVGGCVRDTLMGREPKDIDLATSATPDEQVAIYEANSIRFIPTGLQHGTVTVLLEGVAEGYEITSLRTESDHDGRYATMAYTRDIEEDLSRRDLTINAIALDFDGNFIDPFGGREDIEARRVRFVGNAEERMREDYLRILRFFRFHGRIAGDTPLCPEAVAAIATTREGLRQISVERIWSEMQRIVTGPGAESILTAMRDMGLNEVIGMPFMMSSGTTMAAQRRVTDPAAVMGICVVNAAAIEALADRWKWSTEERKRALFMRQYWRTMQVDHEADMREWKRLLVDGEPMEWVADLMRMQEVEPVVLETWPIPVMPVSGRDLIEAGVKPGPEMGYLLRQMRDQWIASDYKLVREDLLVTEAAGQ